MDRELGDFKAVMMTRDGSVTVTDRLRADALRRSIEKRADHLLFVQVTRIVSERTGLDQPEVWETVPQSALIVEEPDLPPTLIEQRDACRADGGGTAGLGRPRLQHGDPGNPLDPARRPLAGPHRRG
jgi:hypothetical protein